ncbi:hypothetical protein N0V88_005922 [Collariella sp. IMI 366227]|nr:hypothetical protein N0V88_005922 [Collariella sp. IMI 366227]
MLTPPGRVPRPDTTSREHLPAADKISAPPTPADPTQLPDVIGAAPCQLAPTNFKTTPKPVTTPTPTTATPSPQHTPTNSPCEAAPLYEAPSHFWFRAGCFSSGAFCVSYTVYQYWTVLLHPPEGLMWWIPHAFGAIIVFMAGMGAYFVMGAGRIVRSIEAVPAAEVVKKISGKVLAGGEAAGAAKSPIYIEVSTRRMVPFMPVKKTVLLPEEVQLPFRMHSVFSAGGIGALMAQKQMSLAERVRVERAAREAKEAARKHTMDNLMTAPFRDAGKAFGVAWNGIRRSFNREGFAKIKLGKAEYKLDVTDGWALDDGRAMDRLLSVRPNALRG